MAEPVPDSTRAPASEQKATSRSSRRFPLSLQILACMAVGLVVGPWLGPSAAPLGEIGKLVIQLIKAVATPLLFFAIVNAILTSEIEGRAGLRALGFAILNASIALGIGLLLSNLFQPGRSLDISGLQGESLAAGYADKKVDVIKTVSSYVPTNIVQPFAENLVLSVVLLALLFGFAVRRLRREPDPEAGGPHAGAPDHPHAGARVIVDAVAALLRTTEIVLGWVIRLVPLAVFGVVAKTVAEHGFAPLRGLAAYLAIGLCGMALHIAVTYQVWIGLVARIGLRRFWTEARGALVYAAGANSSLATLPLTLRALDRLGVARSASTLGACVATNFNNDGIILYEGMAVLFVAQAHGIHLDLPHQLLAAGSCMVAAMGVAGVPEAGFISLALVLNTVGLPLEILPLLLTVDWVLGRARSITNVLADMVLSILVDRSARASPRAP